MLPQWPVLANPSSYDMALRGAASSLSDGDIWSPEASVLKFTYFKLAIYVIAKNSFIFLATVSLKLKKKVYTLHTSLSGTTDAGTTSTLCHSFR